MLLDGGLSNELERQGYRLDHPLWTARLVATQPEAIIAAHLAYLEAGAQCIITSSYQATLPGFMALGYDRATAESLILRTVELAQEAVERFMATQTGSFRPYIAASIGPYGAYLADGAEYSGDYGISDKALMNFHQPRIRLLETSAADWLACETIPSFQEAKVLSALLKEAAKPSWMTFSCRDEQHLHDGTPLEQCVAYLAGHPRLFALGVNCTAPQYISGLIEVIKSQCGNKKIVVYPNSGERYDPVRKSWSGTSDPAACTGMAKEWLSLGADLIGGCCRMGPEHIKAFREAFNFT